MRRWLILFTLIASFAAAQSPHSDLAAFERELFRLVNQDRTQHGLAAIQLNDRLSEAARGHAELIAQRRQLSHRFPGEASMSDRIAATGVRFDVAGENAAETGDTGDAAHDAAEANTTLMFSPPHRENILNPTHNAVGIAAFSSGGHIWVIEDFARAYPERSVTDVESRAAQALNRARQQHGAPPLAIVVQDGLRQQSCRDNVSPNSLLRQFVSASFALVYTIWNVDQWPPDLAGVATDASMHSAALAACPVAQKEGHGSYRVAVLLFPERSSTSAPPAATTSARKKKK